MLNLHSQVRAIYARAHAEPALPPGPVDLARRLLGPDAIRYVRARGALPAAKILGRERWQLQLREGGTFEEWTFAVGRGLASWWIGSVLGLTHCDYVEPLAVRIILPDPALAILMLCGYDVAEIAEIAKLSERWIAYRMRAMTGRAPRSGEYPRSVSRILVGT